MKKSFSRFIQPQLLRPCLYMAFTRFALGLAFALLCNKFIKFDAALSARAYAFIFLAVFFAGLAWMSYLRLDGVKLPALDRRLFEWKKTPVRRYGDMSDHIDEDIHSFDELEADERDFCRLAADAACCLVFAGLSLI